MGSSTLELGEMSSPEEHDRQRLMKMIAMIGPLTREQLEAVADRSLEGYQWRGNNGFLWEEVVEPGHYEDQVLPLSLEIMRDPALPGHETVYFTGRIDPGVANNRLIDLDISEAAQGAQSGNSMYRHTV